MKEILKYLRHLNSLNQEDVAKGIGMTRQSYIKYESGAIVPSDKIVTKLADFYNVEKTLIYKNEVPVIPSKANKDVLYQIPEHFRTLKIASPVPEDFSAVTLADSSDAKNVYDVYFDGNTLRLTNGETSCFVEGQRFKLVPVDSVDATERKKRAFETINRIVSHKKPSGKAADDDPYYKEALYDALMEKYGSLN